MEAGIRDVRGVVQSPHRTLNGLRVALVHDWLTGMRGGEKCLEVLCRAFPDATLHTLIHRQGALSPAIEAMAIQTSPLQRVPGVFRHYRKLLPVMPLAARTWRPTGVDLVVSLSHCVAKSVRVAEGVPHVCYCFTPMRYAWDQFDAYFGARQVGSAASRLLQPVLRSLARWDAATAGRVDRYVAISQHVASRIRRYYNRDASVIYPPVDTTFFSPDGTEPEPFVLVVSALVP